MRICFGLVAAALTLAACAPLHRVSVPDGGVGSELDAAPSLDASLGDASLADAPLTDAPLTDAPRADAQQTDAGHDADAGAPDAGSCGALTRCGDACVDTSTDPLHCGTCESSCPVVATHGLAVCTGGSCGVECDAGYEPSGSACIDIDECARGLDSCPSGMCRNTSGSYRCLVEVTFNYTGAAQTLSVPTGVTEMTAVALGAQGGCSMGGLGGEATATFPVTPGETISVYVGGAGACGTAGMLPGGFNGGGDKYTDSGDFWLGASGGGASDVRRGGTALANRVIVAGGGGGAGYDDDVAGGAAGGVTGSSGMYSSLTGCMDSRCPGNGGGSSSGGTGGYCHDMCVGLDGTLGRGGRGTGCAASGGGGGGGYYGGGGGAHCPGGGGSSRADFPGNTATSTRAGINAGTGRVTLRY